MNLCKNPSAIPQNESHLVGWILFDDECGICRRLVPKGDKTFKRLHIGHIPLQTPWVQNALQTSNDELLFHFRLLLRTGEIIEDANVYRYVLKRIWWGKPFYILTILPGLSCLFDKAYRRFANNRYKIATFCGLQKPNR